MAVIPYSAQCDFIYHQQVVTEAYICEAQITIILISKVYVNIQISLAVWILTNLTMIFLLSADLSNCKLISFPDGVFKVLRSVSENIHVITLADNEMKALPSKFFTTFTQLRGNAQ